MSNIILKGEYREDGGFLFTRIHAEQARDNGYKLHQKRLHLLQKRLLNREDNRSLEEFPQGHDGTSVTGDFQDMFGQDAR